MTDYSGYSQGDAIFNLVSATGGKTNEIFMLFRDAKGRGYI
jgi:hypothetical protein